jgi:8-oxo-dGTP pyrophosphatase MutT (NUDIX family)
VLHLIPAPLHRLLYRVADRTRRLWWRIRPSPHAGVVVVAFDDRERVLLARHSYGPRAWTLPGGGIHRGESPEQAAVREIREELGCGLTDLVPVDVGEQLPDSPDHQQVLAGRLVGEPVADMREITAIAWVDPDNLPEPCGRRSRRRIAQALAQRRAAAARSEQR